MNDRFSRCLVLVVGDFNRNTAEVLALREFGAGVLAVGTGSAAVRKRLEKAGITARGVGRTKKAVVDAAAQRVGGCDAVLVCDGGWKAVVNEVRDVERQAAIADGRRMIRILECDDPRLGFLRGPRAWAAFTLACAIGVDLEAAKSFAAEQEERGHQSKDPDAGAGRGTGRPARRDRKPR